MKGDLCNSRSDQIHRLSCSFFFIGVNPGALLTDIGHFKEVGIEPYRSDSISVGDLVHSRGAGSYHDPVKAKILDVVLD